MQVRSKSKGTKKLERKNIQLYIGQILKLVEQNRNGDRIKKTVKIKKLYRHYALCQVNGTYNECFSYDDLLSMSGGTND